MENQLTNETEEVMETLKEIEAGTISNVKLSKYMQSDHNFIPTIAKTFDGILKSVENAGKSQKDLIEVTKTLIQTLNSLSTNIDDPDACIKIAETIGKISDNLREMNAENNNFSCRQLATLACVAVAVLGLGVWLKSRGA